jgi:hypothetical protein
MTELRVEIVEVDDGRWPQLAVDHDPHESVAFLRTVSAGFGARPVLLSIHTSKWRLSYVLVLTPLGNGRSLARTGDYGGPWLDGVDRDGAEASRRAIDAALRHLGVVSEVAILSPWLHERELVASVWGASPDKRICTASLVDPSAIARSLSKGRRSDIARGRRDLAVTVGPFSPAAAESFAADYDVAMAAAGAQERWRLAARHFTDLAGAADVEVLEVAATAPDGRARALFLIDGRRASYLYAVRVGDAPGGASLALWEGMEALSARGVESLTLGGGVTSAVDDPLFRFKRSMATDEHDLYLGARVLDLAAHEAAVAKGMARPLPHGWIAP